MIINPIINFTEHDIWEYIAENEIETNPLYEMGFKRVGCVGCPLGGTNNMKLEFEIFPKYKEAYIRAFDRMIKRRKEKGLKVSDKWETGKDVMEWWIGDKRQIKGQMSFKDLIEKEDNN